MARVAILSPDAELSGVRIVAITLLDPSGVSVAQAVAPIEVVSIPPGRAPSDASTEEATAFTGSVAKGASVLLRLGAALDTTLAAASRLPAGVRARIEIVVEGGIRMVIEAPAGPWGTG